MTRDWNPSMAVIANGTQNTGCVLWFTDGSVIEHEIKEVSAHLGDLGLDDAPPGISIWEGTYVWRPGGYECPEDGETYPVGKFRSPTADEWSAIHDGRNPFSSVEGLGKESKSNDE